MKMIVQALLCMKEFIQSCSYACLKHLVAMLVVVSPCFAESLRVGVIAPLTGNLAQFGGSVRNGFEFWKERNPNSPLEFIFEDDQLLPKNSVTAAKKLVFQDKAAAIITVTSSPGMAVAPMAERQRVVHICLTVDSRLASGRYNFVHLFQSKDAVRRLLQKFQAEGIKRVGIFRFIEDAAQLSAAELAKQAPSFGVDVLFEEAFPAGMTDFRSFIERVRAKDAQVLIIIALPPELEMLTKQIRQLQFRPRLTSIEIFSLSVEPHLFDGLWYAQPVFPNAAYVAAFKKRFGQPVGWGHYADNVANLLDAAKSQAGSSRDLSLALASLKDVSSTVGPLSAEGGIFAVPVVIAVMKDGAPEVLEE